MNRGPEAVLGLIASGEFPQLSWLDSGPGGRGFLGAQPDLEVRGDSLALLDEVEQRWRSDPARVWMGWLSYELGADTCLARRPVAHALDGLCLRRYGGALELGPTGVTSHGDPSDVARLTAALEAVAITPNFDSAWPLDPLQACIDAELYRTRVREALSYIRAGDSYQVNVSQPFAARWQARVAHVPLARRVASVYASLRRRFPAAMGGLLADGSRYLVSNSPETLLDQYGTAVSSSPIKGTRPRGTNAAADARAVAALQASAKDAAEHMMIVDLVRNDLGRLCRPGSVRASVPPELMTLPTVHHLVTQVRGELDPTVGLRRVVEALFPGGSVTGAPKRRTVEIIEHLEAEPRGLYCGALVLLHPRGATLSIAIRSGILDAQGLRVHAGGGIVIDSEPEAERLETLAKVRAFAGQPEGQPEASHPAPHGP